MSVAVRSGTNNTRLLEVESTTLAARVVQRPDFADLGHYGVSLVSGTVGAGLAANAEVFHFRLNTSSYIVAVRRVRIWAGGITAFTAGFARFELVPARSWTVDGSGGTAAVLTGNIGKMRTSMSTSSDITARIASTAALTGGTKTLDTASGQGCSSVGGSTTATAGTPIISPMADLFNAADAGCMHPLILDDQEGFIIRATVPATGTWTFGVDVMFEELLAY